MGLRKPTDPWNVQGFRIPLDTSKVSRGIHKGHTQVLCCELSMMLSSKHSVHKDLVEWVSTQNTVRMDALVDSHRKTI